MGDFMNTNQNEYYWQQPGQNSGMNQNFYDQDYSQLANQQLEFSTNDDYSQTNFSNYPQMLIPTQFEDVSKVQNGDDFDEPPLLEELEIYPDRILEKVLAVLNPLRGHGLTDDAEYLTKESDLAGPICFCLLLAASLFVAGKNAHFGYIYGISVISSILMYFLVSLMSSSSGTYTLSTVGSILGYCLIPIVVLSLVGIFFKLSGTVGLILAIIGVLWSSISASRLFVAVSGDKQQQPLIAYPCMLVYGIFTLLVLF